MFPRCAIEAQTQLDRRHLGREQGEGHLSGELRVMDAT